MSAIPPELVQLFKDEAGARLARLSEQLLQLEESGPTPDLIDSVFRDAHTLKGSAGMMGYRGFADVAHRMEDLLHGVRDGARAPTTPLIDALLAAVDGLRTQLNAVIEGTADAGALADLEMRLLAAAEAPAGSAPPTTTPTPPPSTGADDAFARVPVARVDAMARLAGEASVAHTRLVAALAQRLGPGVSLPADVYALGNVLHELEARTGQARMVPLAGVVEPLRRAVRDIAKAQDKAVRFEVEGEDTELDRGVLDRLADALLQLVRNAVDHGVEPPVERVQAGKKAQAVVRVSARQQGRDVVVAVTDDGRGIDLDRVKQAAGLPNLTDDEALERLYHAGFSTAAEVTAVSGRGVGLDVVRSALAPVRGRADVRTERGKGTTFVITVPLTVASVPCLMLRCDGQAYALALSSVVTTRTVREGDEPLGSVLGVPVLSPRASVVVTDGQRRRSFSVDELLDERDVVVKGLGALPLVPVVAGAAVGPDGRAVVVLDAAGLLDRAPSESIPAETEPEPERPPCVLVVDDDAVVRDAHHTLLARAGYDVRTANDGLDALAQLRRWPADLALVDIQMPLLDGLALIEAIRVDPILRGMAVIVLTSLGSEDDRVRGMEAGADAYMVKGAFDADGLLHAVGRLLGRA
jgi:two-component system, chemotaxis family, sensor kinase CheA